MSEWFYPQCKTEDKMTVSESCAASSNDSMSNQVTISETFVKERYIVSHEDKYNILPMVQMKICGINLKVLTKKKVEKPGFIVEA